MWSFNGFVAVLLLWAILAATYQCGNRRAFWLGFSVFGWGYLVLVYGPIPRLELPTTALLQKIAIRAMFEQVESTLPPESTLSSGVGTPTLLPPPTPLPAEQLRSAWDYNAFEDIGHAVFTLPFAMIGGIVSKILASRRD
jgi:hypothetical protein